MKLFSSVGDYFALDIGTTAVRVVQLSGTHGAWSLSRYSSVPVDIKVSSSNAVQDQRKLGEIILTAVGQSGIRAHDVVLGIPSDKIFTTVIDLPDMPASELATTIKYQAEQYIPMNINEVKVDWAMLGKSVNDPSKNEVLLTSAQNSFTEARLDLVESLGFNVIAIEPDSLALTRSLLPKSLTDARVIVEVGDFTTDIIVTYGDAPRLMRSLPTGMQSFVKTAGQNLNIKPEQAVQFILKFGLQQDKLEGQIYRALQSSVDQLATEVEKSVKFFKTKYPSIPVGGIIVSNYGVTISGLSEYLSDKLSIKAQYGDPWQTVRVSPDDKIKLEPLSSQFAVAIGLAERGATE